RRGFPALTAAVGLNDRCRPGFAEDGAGDPPPLRSDAGTEMGDLHGGMRYLRRRLQQLCSGTRGQPGDSRGCICSRLPASSGAITVRADAFAGKDSTGTAQPVEDSEHGVVALWPWMSRQGITEVIARNHSMTGRFPW